MILNFQEIEAYYWLCVLVSDGHSAKNFVGF
ncbi:hypothetical protein T11_4283 [Trichinella zimbabwensis]|uniref:Uncharacterized protein n=1 Tax=Trichinella zimbabwensis TaxID=268475 RepID=A0A0V1G865_9BILA|nr:hypothetical protein T11_4283 [Trichinella zimbabwensis]